MRAIDGREARAIDVRAAELGIPSLCLMENAGAGAARIAEELTDGRGGRVVCLCGPGNNGGDALVAARHLAIAGARVMALLLPRGDGGGAGGDAGVQARICRAMGLPLAALEPGALPRDDVALWIDGLFGTGLDRPLAGAAADVVLALRQRPEPVLALDVPSGLSCDTGRPLGPCVRAQVTATFAADKVGFRRPGAREFTGEVRVVPIGAPVDPVGGGPGAS